ncbi:MAG: CRISPR-associated helicase Cas3' [Bacteroidota bacterium]|nr:CRISPR-associated helicase Cas3' [Bacteroidota bacterium]
MPDAANSMPAWGKFDEASGRIHLLEHHCADVAASFEALLADPILVAKVAAACGTGDRTDLVVQRLTYLTYLHDFGKVSTGFQFKVSRREGLHSRTWENSGHIGVAFACFGSEAMVEAFDFRELYQAWGDGLGPLLLAALAHHGRPAREPNSLVGGGRALWQPRGSYNPCDAAQVLVKRGKEWFPKAFESGPPLPAEPELAHLFAGLVALADQIGSNEEFFRFEDARDPNYIARARRRAQRAVLSRKFSRHSWAEGAPKPTVHALFDHPVPRPVQEILSEAPLDYPLVVLESETGSGKTEAAILRFATLWRARLVDGLYFALPTRAAAKQLHSRVDKALRRLLPDQAMVQTVLAVPGYIQAGSAEGRRAGKFSVFWEDKPDEELRQARWAAESSRNYLSAPAAVGTVDQVLLAGLRVKWAHLRSASLARSLLVVDEVHASDAYMSEILKGVLKAHLALGGHALVMSATLGSSARQSLMGAQQPMDLSAATSYPYPTVSLAGSVKKTRAIPILGGTRFKRVAMNVGELLTEPLRIADRAIEAARRGARVLIIRNTVLEAIAVWKAICDQHQQRLLLRVKSVPTLHHSRFAVEDRHLLDQEVEGALGKSAPYGTGTIVVGTQTLEQSLDIDSDLLITDICPVDVLLQRIGRLHRHERANRPSGWSTPRCLVITPQGDMGDALRGKLLRYGLGSGKQGGVYPNVVCLEATRRLVLEMPFWTVPGDCRKLVEEATHPESLAALAQQLGNDWREHLTKIEGETAAGSVFARLHALRRTESFDEKFVFPDIDQMVRSRIGEDGPRIKLTEPVRGPFNELVSTFNLPGHMFQGKMPDKAAIESATLVNSASGIRILEVGEHRFSYGAEGVRRLPKTD